MMKLSIILFITVTTQVHGQLSTPHFYPYGKERGDMVFTDGDDEAILVELNTSFRFYGHEYQSLYINVNGLISFKEPPKSYFDIAEVSRNLPLVSLFPSDFIVDSVRGGKIMYREVDLAKEADICQLIIIESKTTGERITPTLVFIVTWKDVRLKNNVNYRHSFQLVLASDGSRTLIISTYRTFTYGHDTIHYLNGDGRHERYDKEKEMEFSLLTNAGIPGRIIQRAGQDYINLTDIRNLFSTAICEFMMTSREISTLNGRMLHFEPNGSRIALLSKMYQPEGDSRHDRCKFKLIVRLDDKGNFERAKFSVGVHRRNPRRFRRTFVFERGQPTQVLIKGWKYKKGIRDFPHYETVAEDEQQVIVQVEKSGDMWAISSVSCQYLLTYIRDGLQENMLLELGRYFDGKTVGLCQSFVWHVPSKDCSQPPKVANDSEIYESCSCPPKDRKCIKRLNT